MNLICIVVLLQANPLIEEMVNNVSSDSILATVQRLQDFVTRWCGHDSCFAAADWIYNKFIAYGMDSVYYDTFSYSFPVPGNVVGIKNGEVYPESCYTVIGAHFDAMVGIAHEDSAPGADDNASGVAAVLEAARIMKDYQFESNIRFIAFSTEEPGILGSGYYAWRASLRGDDIHAVFNFDMIGYADAQPESIEVGGRVFCDSLIDYFIACADTYTTLLATKRLGLIVGDEGSFSHWGYPAIVLIEDWPLTNPYYHTQADTIGAGFNDLGFCTEVVKAGVAALASTSIPVGISEGDEFAAKSNILLTIFPNPFIDKTVIRYYFEGNSDATMDIYDINGRLVRTFSQSTAYSLASTATVWDGRDNTGKKVPSGVYFLRLKAGDYSATEKLLLIR